MFGSYKKQLVWFKVKTKLIDCIKSYKKKLQIASSRYVSQIKKFKKNQYINMSYDKIQFEN